LDSICRSRPWATNKDQGFEYPFRKATEEMVAAEGNWKGFKGARKNTRRETVGDPLKQLQVPGEFPPACRVLLFTPEFGNDRSYDAENLSYLEPETMTDVWVVSWQGWSNFDDMLKEVSHSVLSFADGVSTVWYGQGMGALVAYELLKMLDINNDTSPNLPVSLVVCDCPAPHLFADNYKPYDMDGWSEAMASDKIIGVQKPTIDGDLAIMKKYRFQHNDNKDLPMPITAFFHDGNSNASSACVGEWEAYCKKDGFELADALDEEEVEIEEYLRGKGYALNLDPAIVSTLNQHHEQFNRPSSEERADIGPTDGDIPEEIDCVIIGAGLNGIIASKWLSEAGKSLVILDKYHAIGGVWEFHGNDYSRVNTSEIGYRLMSQTGRWARCNEDHTPKAYIMKDMYEIIATHCHGRVRVNMQVTKLDKPAVDGGRYVVHCKNVKTGKEYSIKAGSVHFNVNRRIGERRIVDFPGLEKFKGRDLYGYGGENKGINFWGKNSIIVGAGAFAFENIRTCIEHGTKLCTMLCRREGTASPKWVDQLAFFRPLDESMLPHKSGNMISFDVWRSCYTRSGLKTPACWDEGLLKPDNHTISTSDLVYIAAYHGLYKMKVGEIKEYTDDGRGVELKDGSRIETDFVVKCVGFHLSDTVEKVTGCTKMYPWGSLMKNVTFVAEPLLDGGQFGGAKGGAAYEIDLGFTPEMFEKGVKSLQKSGDIESSNSFGGKGNPFGSGAGGPAEQSSRYIVWLLEHQAEQDAMFKVVGPPVQETTKLWASHIGQNMGLMVGRIVASFGTNGGYPQP